MSCWKSIKGKMSEHPNSEAKVHLLPTSVNSCQALVYINFKCRVNYRSWYNKRINHFSCPSFIRDRIWDFWPLNIVKKLTKINNALEKNKQKLGVYRVHDLRKQQSISLKGQRAIKPAQTAQPPLSFFLDNTVTHIFPIFHGIITQKPWKSILDLFSV